jgi:hypothetical protein
MVSRSIAKKGHPHHLARLTRSGYFCSLWLALHKRACKTAGIGFLKPAYQGQTKDLAMGIDKYGFLKTILQFYINHIVIAELAKIARIAQKDIGPTKHFETIGKSIGYFRPYQCIFIG